MLNVKCPDRNAENDVECIVSEKYSGQIKTTLQGLKSKINNRYSEYFKIEHNQRIEPSVFSIEETEALKHLYSSKTTTARLIIGEITKTQLSTQAGCCLSCGIGEADQIDHFLPQAHFPEYSIMHKNLLPICGTCNEIKGDNIPGLNKNFFHPMFDKLPDDKFFDCQITYLSNIPHVYFAIHPEYQGTIIAQHFNDLKLKDRLEKKAIQYFVQIVACKYDFGVEFAIDEIRRDITKLGSFFGVNYWKYILCTEMIKMNFITNV